MGAFSLIVVINLLNRLNMGDIEDQDFEEVGAGASETYPQQCSALRNNGYVMIKDRPCKIVEMSTSKTGKHGHAKVHMVGIDIFNQKKYEDICPSTHNMDVPHVARKDYQFVDIDEDGYVDVMEEDGTTNQYKVPEGEVMEEIKQKQKDDLTFLITVLKACGEEQVISTKDMS